LKKGGLMRRSRVETKNRKRSSYRVRKSLVTRALTWTIQLPSNYRGGVVSGTEGLQHTVRWEKGRGNAYRGARIKRGLRAGPKLSGVVDRYGLCPIIRTAKRGKPDRVNNNRRRSRQVDRRGWENLRSGRQRGFIIWRSP